MGQPVPFSTGVEWNNYVSNFTSQEVEDVVGWIQRKKVSSEERLILSAALSEVVSPDDVPDDENVSGREQ